MTILLWMAGSCLLAALILYICVRSTRRSCPELAKEDGDPNHKPGTSGPQMYVELFFRCRENLAVERSNADMDKIQCRIAAYIGKLTNATSLETAPPPVHLHQPESGYDYTDDLFEKKLPGTFVYQLKGLMALVEWEKLTGRMDEDKLYSYATLKNLFHTVTPPDEARF